MQQLYSIGRIAAILAEATGEDASILEPRVRSFVARGWLKPCDVLDARRTLGFEDVEIYAAALYGALPAAALDVSRIGPALNDGAPGAFGLRQIVERVAAGESWRLRIRHIRDGRRNFQTARIERSDTPAESMTPEIARLLEASHLGRRVEAVTEFNLADVWAGLPPLAPVEGEG